MLFHWTLYNLQLKRKLGLNWTLQLYVKYLCIVVSFNVRKRAGSTVVFEDEEPYNNISGRGIKLKNNKTIKNYLYIL